MEGILAALLGIAVGSILTELIRRRNRIEAYSQPVFARRLEVHEQLYRMVYSVLPVFVDVVDNDSYDDEERLLLVSDAVLALAKYCDDNALYLDERLIVHCAALMMGVEDIHGLPDEDDRRTAVEGFYHNHKLAKRMIKDNSGISRLERLFCSISKPKLNSDLIEYYESLSKKRGRL